MSEGKNGVILLLSTGFQLLEVMGPVDFLNKAGIPIKLVAVGVTGLEIEDGTGHFHKADITLDQVNVDDYEGILVTGGIPSTQTIATNNKCVELIKEFNSKGKLVASICGSTGAILAEACQILKGKRAVGYPGTDTKITENGGIKEENRVCTDGNIITSRGPATSLEWSIEIIRYLRGQETADNVSTGTLMP
ncbi:DJ-1 family protein [Histomonas meleagridis]|uniref:DJ-1 family protein n=1 Tax=Histomonas meleagridis TaxID=135588 RepID=UPI00355ACB5D|nr:DJ-1 family protein [Histomonas meleagridis]KAH0796915.1 DJ-1 family protein [Histomonas meleagridis]